MTCQHGRCRYPKRGGGEQLLAFGLLLYKAIILNGVDPSFVSATLSSVKDKPVTLDSGKLKSLAAWFAGHSTGWRPMFGTPPPANYNLRLRYPNGSEVLFGISRSYSADSRGTIYVVPNGASRPLSHQELIELFSILES